LEDALEHYDSVEDQDYIRNLVNTRGQAAQMTEEENYVLSKIVGSIDDNTSTERKENFIDILERIYLDHDAPGLYSVDEGEDLKISIRIPRSKSLKGEVLIALDANKNPLTAEDNGGTTDRIQSLTLTDISFTTEEFHKVYIVTERFDVNETTSTGDVEEVLEEAYIYVEPTTDRS
uniref:hypothetical protein n=1 Tax=Methanohalobium sp. TaxID=2837493 RepID=UPI0025D63503